MAGIKCRLIVLKPNANAKGTQEIRKRSFQIKIMLDRLPIIRDTMRPIMEPRVKLRAAPVPLYDGINIK